VFSQYLNRKDLVLLGFLLLLASALRFYRLGDASFWIDEVYTAHTSQLPWSTLWVTAYNPTPPLFFSVIKLLTQTGDSEWWFRLPSALSGVVTVFFVYVAVRILSDTRTAVASALLLTFSIGNIEYSQEARSYALVSMFISLSFLGLASLHARWQHDIDGFSFSTFLKSGGAVFGIGVLGALYSHNTAVFYWLGVQLFFLAWWVKPFRFDRSCLASWFLVNLLVLLLWLPWFIASLQVMESGSFDWLKNFSWSKALNVWIHVHGVMPDLAIQPWANTLLLLLALVGAYGLRKQPVVLLTLLSLVVFSSLVIWAYGYIERPVYMRRTILWGTLFTTILIAIGLNQLPTLVANALLVFLVVVGAMGFHSYNGGLKAGREDWRSAGARFGEEYKPEDILVFRSSFTAIAFLYYAQPYLQGETPDFRVLGLHCRKGKAQFGKITRTGDLLEVSWRSKVPDWDLSLSETSGANAWVVEASCNSAYARKQSDQWLSQFWRPDKHYEFRRINLYKLAPNK